MNIRTYAAYPARLAVIAFLAAFLVASPALAAFRFGTNGNDTLVGTSGNDDLTGREGNDKLKGLAGNDTYYFANNFGTDTIVEKAGQGSDTVNFHNVTNSTLTVSLVPEWVSLNPLYNAASVPGGEVRLAYPANGQTVQSTVENLIGGQGNGDILQGGGVRNIFQPGGGADDTIADYAGWNDGAGGRPEIPASNDLYKGFASNTGTDRIVDYGGNGDRLDMRPFSTADVFMTSIDLDGQGKEESLQIVTSPTTQIIVLGQLGAYGTLTSDAGYHGRIETIIFADRTITDTTAARSLVTDSRETLSAKQAQLANAAEGLAKQARALLDTNDLLGLHPTPDGTARGESTRSERQQTPDKHNTQHHARTRR